MPYIFKEELDEGESAADVVEREYVDTIAQERDTAIADRDSAYAARDTAIADRESIISERDNLAQELDNAKAKFANAFLSSPNKMKSNQRDDSKDDGKVQSFEQLFSGRNKYNAN